MLRSALSYWCERGDSNPHGFTRQILSLVRLPIPPLSQLFFNYIQPLVVGEQPLLGLL